MTICIATSNFPPQIGGIATFYGHLTNLLIKEGHRVLVLIPDDIDTKNNADEITERGGLTTIVLRNSYRQFLSDHTPYFPPGGLCAAGWIATGMAMKDWLLKNHKTYGIDIIEVSDYGGAGIFLMSGNLPPVVVTGHGTFTQLSRYNSVREDSQTEVVRKLELLSLQKADAILPYSPLNQADLTKLVKRQILFATAPWQESKKEIEKETDDFIYVAGGLQKIKGAVVLARAIRILAKQNDQIRLYWAGGDTYTAPRAKKMSEYLQKKFPDIWDKNFIWLKELLHSESMDRMARSAIVVIPSEWETLNFVALEAASLNKPIIMTSSTGAAYLFHHGEDAYIVPANDPGQLAEAILYLQNNTLLRNKLGTNAAASLKKVFEGKKGIEERILIYTKVIQNRRTAGNRIENELSFLSEYLTPGRKYFLKVKDFLKRVLSR
ncbi:MAG: glycosyltransferase family 4 protein [Chitinophagaceae bacterium]